MRYTIYERTVEKGRKQGPKKQSNNEAFGKDERDGNKAFGVRNKRKVKLHITSHYAIRSL